MKRNYALIGDLHSQVEPAVKALRYCEKNNLRPLFLGDCFDSRVENSNSVEVYRLLKRAQAELGAVVLRSNHQDKFERYIQGRPIKFVPELERTIADFKNAAVDLKEVGEWMESLPYIYCFRDDRGREYRCAHAFVAKWVEIPEYTDSVGIHQLSSKAKSLALYGPKTRETTDRLFWWNLSSQRKWVRVSGHYHVVHTSEYNLVLDGGCGSVKRSWFCNNPPSLVLWDTSLRQLVEFEV